MEISKLQQFITKIKKEKGLILVRSLNQLITKIYDYNGWTHRMVFHDVEPKAHARANA